jgi:hypothetical protein
LDYSASRFPHLNPKGNAEAYAAYAVEFAASAIEEAAYAVLDAELARKESEQLSAS